MENIACKACGRYHRRYCQDVMCTAHFACPYCNAGLFEGDFVCPKTQQSVVALDAQVGGDHYRTMKIQPAEFLHANGIPFIEGAVIKYMCRWRSKGGLQDLEKARHFIDLLIGFEKKSIEARPANATSPLG